MPIGGFVITIDTAEKETILKKIEAYTQIEVHGTDEKGNVVAVLDTESSEEMEELTSQLQKTEGILSVGIAFFDAEDEIEKIHQGIIKPTFSFGRKNEKPERSS